MSSARQTPRGARPNRRGGLARPVELRSLQTGVSRSEGEPSGRLLEPLRELRPRGMIVTAQRCKAKRRTESGLQAHPPLSFLFSLYPSWLCLLLCPLCVRYLQACPGASPRHTVRRPAKAGPRQSYPGSGAGVRPEHRPCAPKRSSFDTSEGVSAADSFPDSRARDPRAAVCAARVRSQAQTIALGESAE